MKVSKEFTKMKRLYSELEAGTCFELIVTGDIFIKTNLIIAELGRREIAIRLEDGKDFYFQEDITVNVLDNAEIVIGR